jgi:hypothetical protein
MGAQLERAGELVSRKCRADAKMARSVARADVRNIIVDAGGAAGMEKSKGSGTARGGSGANLAKGVGGEARKNEWPFAPCDSTACAGRAEGIERSMRESGEGVIDPKCRRQGQSRFRAVRL